MLRSFDKNKLVPNKLMVNISKHCWEFSDLRTIRMPQCCKVNVLTSHLVKLINKLRVKVVKFVIGDIISMYQAPFVEVPNSVSL